MHLIDYRNDTFCFNHWISLVGNFRYHIRIGVRFIFIKQKDCMYKLIYLYLQSFSLFFRLLRAVKTLILTLRASNHVFRFSSDRTSFSDSNLILSYSHFR